ncbi:hotdog fold thioesterase [Nitratireductor sp. CAU 1489]|uniref:Hotdog fold thioesterase n=1 Tax=Nitratireductor arenosus TaxID=2682096 RepID=A0A844QJY3_9HYPH|nr:PaaI family thioesterase [Nitratireductor arenosus]MVA99912.1 hotdog fold thioesterase [Nitratireductor arenosus]
MIHPDARQWIDQVLAGSPVARRIGLRFTTVEPDRVVATLPFDPDNVTVDDIVHGGVIATLIDIAGAAASASGIGDSVAGGATATMSIAYLAPAHACDLAAEAVVVQRGRTQTVADIAVRDPRGRAIATGIVTSRIFLREA